MFDFGSEFVGIEHAGLFDDRTVRRDEERGRCVDQADGVNEVTKVVAIELVGDTAVSGEAVGVRLSGR